MSLDDKTPVGYQQLTVSSTAVGFTLPSATAAGGAPITKPIRFALVRCSTANVRWRDDGTDPTASVGVPLNAGETLEYDGNFATVKFIRQSSDATLDISYYI